jgi:hypothetical protein
MLKKFQIGEFCPFPVAEYFLKILLRFWRVFWIDASTTKTIELSLREFATDPGAKLSGTFC